MFYVLVLYIFLVLIAVLKFSICLTFQMKMFHINLCKNGG